MSTKKYLIFLAILLSSFAGFSQTSTDTSITCIPNYQLRIAARKITEGSINADRVLAYIQKTDTLQGIVQNLEARLSAKDSIIHSYQFLNLRTEQSYRDELANLGKQTAAYQVALDRAVKKVNGQRRKTIFVAIVSVGGSILINSLIHAHY